ncbi:MAG: FecR domain-containing protein [Spirochaetes bacterium]|nr:FecR domain-containing protein [Spirochaetota bacterium]
MKKILFLLSVLLLFNSGTNSYAAQSVGRIIQLTGDVDLTDEDSGSRIIAAIGTRLKTTQRIRTGMKSYAEILLFDNTKIFLRELSVLQITGIKNQSDDSPTKIKFDIGKLRLNIDKNFKGRNLIFKTNAAIIGVNDVQTDFAVITSEYQTKLAVFEGRAEIANSNRNIIKSFTVKTNEEVSIVRNSAPSEPVALPQDILDSWLDHYYVKDKRRILVKDKQETSILDYILRKRQY